MAIETETRDAADVDARDVRKLIGQVGRLEGQNEILIETLKGQNEQMVALMTEQGRQDRENYRLLDGKIENVRGDMSARIDGVRTELGDRIDANGGRIDANGERIDSLRTELMAKIDANSEKIDRTRKDLNDRIDKVRDDLTGKIDNLRSDMEARFQKQTNLQLAGLAIIIAAIIGTGILTR